MVYVYNSNISSIVGYLTPHIAIVTKNMSNTSFCDIECFCTTENQKNFKEGTIIEINGIHGDLFRIKNPISTGTRLKAKCYSLYEDTKSYVIHSLVLENEPVLTALEKVKKACDSVPFFSFQTDFPNDVKLSCSFSNTTLFAVLENIAELTGGFLKIKGTTIYLLTSLGKNRTEVLRYGDNIQRFQITEDWSNVCTKIFPIGKDGIMLDEVHLESETQYDKPYTQIVEFEQEFEVDASVTVPIPQTLYELAIKTELKHLATTYLKEHSEPDISYEVEAHINFDIDIGDILPVKYPKLSFDREVQVQELQWDAVSRKYKSIKFGKTLPTISGLYSDLTVKTSGNISSQGVWNRLKLSDNFAVYDSKGTNFPAYKNTGGVVSIRGVLTVEEALTTSEDNIIIASGIPEACRPAQPVRVVCQGSGINRWLCTVGSNGNVYLSRYGTTENVTIKPGVWLPFNITYLI